MLNARIDKMLNNTEVQALILQLVLDSEKNLTLRKLDITKLFYWQMLMLTEAT